MQIYCISQIEIKICNYLAKVIFLGSRREGRQTRPPCLNESIQKVLTLKTFFFWHFLDKLFHQQSDSLSEGLKDEVLFLLLAADIPLVNAAARASVVDEDDLILGVSRTQEMAPLRIGHVPVKVAQDLRKQTRGRVRIRICKMRGRVRCKVCNKAEGG